MNQPMPHQPVSTVSPTTGSIWHKTISMARDHRQSRLLSCAVTSLLLLGELQLARRSWQAHSLSPWPLLFSLVFALTVWRLRAATAAASAIGALICLLLASPASGSSTPLSSSALSPALLPLILLFLLTFAATRFRRRLKEAAGLAEARHGRRASQIVANLGVAGLCAAIGFYGGALAALAEATADTLSSEIGQALGGPTWLLTSRRPVTPGTDGGVSLRGTVAGLFGAALVVLSGAAWLPSTRSAALVYLSGAAGLIFDSLLGATLERRGVLGNDLVNFTSTLFSVLLLWLLLKVLP